MKAAWSSPIGRIVGAMGEARDPGTGQDRYRGAFDLLVADGGKLALAAFTFDPDEPGSVVVMAGPDVPIAIGSPIPSGRVTDDGRSEWEAGFDDAITSLASGEVAKVVLARRVTCVFESEVDPATVWRHLIDQNPGTYCFLIDGFVGASPELLVRVDDDRVESLALAGTAATEDALENEQILTEHRHTAESVGAALAPLTTEFSADRGIHRFGGLTHVGTRFEGKLKPGVTVLDVLADLHPTAAVAGTPRDASLDLIRRIEGPRGLYAGPVGWFDRDGNGEFAIALRCGRITDSQVTLYAGGGLLVGSDRDRESKETDLKLRPMLRALGLES
ncbi:MAG TPA: chorismate-binding protein [Acidimicrobiia bacterium]